LVCAEIHNQKEGTYYQYRNMLTQIQWNLLTAIAKEEKVNKPNSKDFIQKYKLGAVSSVNRSLVSLQEKELIHRTSHIEAPYYIVNDKFLMRWLQRK